MFDISVDIHYATHKAALQFSIERKPLNLPARPIDGIKTLSTITEDHKQQSDIRDVLDDDPKHGAVVPEFVGEQGEMGNCLYRIYTF
jgi:hypothetical protein